jgi:hypothetical protein
MIEFIVDEKLEYSKAVKNSFPYKHLIEKGTITGWQDDTHIVITKASANDDGEHDCSIYINGNYAALVFGTDATVLARSGMHVHSYAVEVANHEQVKNIYAADCERKLRRESTAACTLHSSLDSDKVDGMLHASIKESYKMRTEINNYNEAKEALAQAEKK